MKKKEKILLIIGMILFFGLGFLIRGILLVSKIDIPADLDEAQIRAEIEQDIQQQVKKEIDAKVMERLEYTLLDEALNQALPVEQRMLMGEVVDRDEEKREIKVKVINRLAIFRGGNFIEFLFDQPHYFIKTVAITDDTIFFGRVENDILNFQDIVLGARISVIPVQPFEMGTQETLTARRAMIFPAFAIDDGEVPE